MDFEFLDTVKAFDGFSFSTLEFAKKLEKKYESIWSQLVDKYGEGGKGAGTNYSAYSYTSQQLNKLWNAGSIEKLDYRKAPPEFGNPWIRYWAENDSYRDFPNEINDEDTVTEGAKKQVIVNRYERDRGARTRCIEEHGVSCSVCNFDFENFYGSVGAGFIHVHHLTPLSKIGESYELDPVEELRPVCPNCHAMLHRSKDGLSIEELKNSIANE